MSYQKKDRHRQRMPVLLLVWHRLRPLRILFVWCGPFTLGQTLGLNKGWTNMCNEPSQYEWFPSRGFHNNPLGLLTCFNHIFIKSGFCMLKVMKWGKNYGEWACSSTKSCPKIVRIFWGQANHKRVRLGTDCIVPTCWSWITEPPLVGQAPSWVCMMKQPHMFEPCHIFETSEMKFAEAIRQ